MNLARLVTAASTVHPLRRSSGQPICSTHSYRLVQLHRCKLGTSGTRRDAASAKGDGRSAVQGKSRKTDTVRPPSPTSHALRTGWVFRKPGCLERVRCSGGTAGDRSEALR
jgi:hypothetical protein